MKPPTEITFTTQSLIIALAWFGLVPSTFPISPPPDGGYPGGNTAEGQNALFSLTSGGYNTAAGFFALRSDTTGSFNTGFGAGALFTNNADQNCAFGVLALFANTGPSNSAFGYSALMSNTANANAAFGAYSLLSNTSGNFNTATGFSALQNNTTGVQNTATGSGALLFNTIGSYNTAAGVNALLNNTAGSPNTAFGWGALEANTAGNNNTAIGYAALYSNTNGSYNTAVGDGALYSNTTGNHNLAIGVDAAYNMTGSRNIILGNFAGTNLTSETDNIHIGNAGVAGDFQTIRIGTENVQFDTFLAGIDGAPVTGTPVVVNGDGQLGVAPSSERFKDDIKPMDRASGAILALKPVSFRYKKKIDPQRTPQFGLVAEEVAKVNPELVVRDKQGKPYSVRYDQVNAMLLNEFLKEHRKVEQQEFTIAQLKNEIQAIVAHSKEQDSEIRKVRSQIQMSTCDAVVAVKHN